MKQLLTSILIFACCTTYAQEASAYLKEAADNYQEILSAEEEKESVREKNKWEQVDKYISVAENNYQQILTQTEEAEKKMKMEREQKESAEQKKYLDIALKNYEEILRAHGRSTPEDTLASGHFGSTNSTNHSTKQNQNNILDYEATEEEKKQIRKYHEIALKNYKEILDKYDQ